MYLGTHFELRIPGDSHFPTGDLILSDVQMVVLVIPLRDCLLRKLSLVKQMVCHNHLYC